MSDVTIVPKKLHMKIMLYFEEKNGRYIPKTPVTVAFLSNALSGQENIDGEYLTADEFLELKRLAETRNDIEVELEFWCDDCGTGNDQLNDHTVDCEAKAKGTP